MKTILFSVLFIPLLNIAQTGPAGIGNCVLWLRSDAGTMNGATYQTPFGSLTDWDDQSGSGNDAVTSSGTPFKTSSDTTAERRINYNSTVFFDAVGEEFVGTDLGMNGSTALTEFFVTQLSTTAATGYSAVFSLGGNSAGFHRLENDFFYNSMTIFDNNYTSNLAAAHSSNTMEDQSIKTGLQNGTNFRGFHNGGLTTTTNEVPGVSASGSYRVGDIESGGNDFSIGEIIIFNTDLSLNNRIKIQTYLAVKYGITLSHSYRNTDNTEIYDNSTYANDIIGIAREDVSSLLQKQSHQLNDKDSTRLYLDILQTLNVNNTGTFTSDKQYLVMGHDNGALNGNSNPTEFPGGQSIINRIEREWKLTNTNFSGATFSIDIKLTNSPIDPNHLRLLIDSDSDLSDGTVLNPTMSFSNEVLTISGLDVSVLPINSTRYFTVVSINSLTPLPINLLTFEANATPQNEVLLEWQTASELNNAFFTIERSINGFDWEEVKRIDGAGNSSSILNYSTIDENPFKGWSYYRLKQTDFDGQFEYSNVKSVSLNTIESSKVQLYPNPTNNHIMVIGDISELSEVRIFNPLGQDVTNLTTINNINESTMVIDLSYLAKGMYHIKTRTTANNVYKK